MSADEVDGIAAAEDGVGVGRVAATVDLYLDLDGPAELTVAAEKATFDFVLSSLVFFDDLEGLKKCLFLSKKIRNNMNYEYG